MFVLGDRIMCKVCEVGKIVVNKCLEKGYPINTQKLQKLLVLIQGECLVENEKPLFEESVEIWKCGVAIREVNDGFQRYSVAFDSPLTEYVSLLEQENKIIEHIIDKYGRYDVATINQDVRLVNLIDYSKQKGIKILDIETIREEFLKYAI